MRRTPAEVGAIVRARRDLLGKRQTSFPGIISAPLIGQIERGTAPQGERGSERQRFMVALGWPPDALARLAAGEDPDTFPQELPGRSIVTTDQRLDDVERRVTHIEQLLERALQELQRGRPASPDS